MKYYFLNKWIWPGKREVSPNSRTGVEGQQRAEEAVVGVSGYSNHEGSRSAVQAFLGLQIFILGLANFYIFHISGTGFIFKLRENQFLVKKLESLKKNKVLYSFWRAL